MLLFAVGVGRYMAADALHHGAAALLCMLVSGVHLAAAAAAAAGAVVWLKVTRTMRLLTSEPSVLPAIKESGAIGQLVRRFAAAAAAAAAWYHDLHHQLLQHNCTLALYRCASLHMRIHNRPSQYPPAAAAVALPH
jgi:hypothetical protein